MSRYLLRKAQVNAFMSILVVVFFIVFAFIGLVIYSTAELRTKQVEVQISSEQRAREITNVLLAMPELRCSIENRWERYCIDSTKIPLHDDPYFDGILGFTLALVALPGDPIENIYSASPEMQQKLADQVIFNNALPNSNATESTTTPITFYDPRSESYEYGVLRVWVTS